MSKLIRKAILLFLFSTAITPVFAVIRDGGVDPSNLGQGGWLYIMGDATNKLGGNVSSVTNESSLFAYMKGVGFNYVIVKAGTSNTLWNGSYSSPQFTAALVNSAHSNGLFIFGSNRSWGNDNPGEVAVADYIFNQGADGYIWDAESEWESGNPWITNGPAQAWNLCMTIRSHWTNKFLAHNPYDTLYLHSTFPYKEFGYWSDAVMPQVYHHSASQGNAFAAIMWTDFNYRMFQNTLPGLGTTANAYGSGINATWTNSLKPLVFMRDVYGANYSTPYPPQDVQNFLDYMVSDPNCVTAGGYQGSDYFRSELYDTNQWAFMKAATIGVFSNVVNNIVIDDPTATRVGAWTAVRTMLCTTSTITFSGATGTDTNSFGTNYLTKTQGTGSSYVQFNPNILTAGIYKVYQWHPFRADASTNTPFAINTAFGVTNVFANQQTNNGNWSQLGQFVFSPGTGGYIRVMDNIPEAAGVAIADGIKLVFVSPVPTPVISGVTPSIGDTNVGIAWTTDIGSDSAVDYGATTNYGSTVSNATSVTSHGIILTGLTPSTMYHYRVKSKGATTSQGVTGDFTFITNPQGVVSDLIIDNTNAVVVGTNWSTGTASPDKYGPDYRFDTQGTGANYLQYIPLIPEKGPYQVYAWYPQGSNRTTNAPYVIDYNGGTQTIYVNQQTNGGQWNLLGKYIFAAGTSGDVKITDAFPDAGKVVMADAVKFVHATPTMPQISQFTLVSGQVQLTVSGDAGGNYVLQTSSNLVTWSNVVLSLSTNGTLQFLNAASNSPDGFYRVYYAP
jgi:hypothetical protein